MSSSTQPAWTVYGDGGNSSQFGFDVAGAGDVNGDGLDDILVGAFFYDGLQTDEGRAYVYCPGP